MSSLALLPSNAVELHGDRPFTTSLMVSEVFGKRHDNVIRDIETLDCSPEFRSLNFEERNRETVTGKNTVQAYRYFEITKNGFVFLVMGYTGPKAAQFKEAYIVRFDEMEAALHQPALSPEILSAHLKQGRWLVAFPDGRMHLTELADDQHMISPGEWLDFLTLPKFPVALLPDVLEAVGKRLQGIEGPLPGRQGRRRGAPCVERVAPEQVVESRFLRLWQALVPNPITAVALSAMVRERVPMVSGDGQPRYPELQEAAIQMMGDLSQWDVRELGYRLRAVAGRIHDGRRVVRTRKGLAGVRWMVESVTDVTTEPWP